MGGADLIMVLRLLILLPILPLLKAQVSWWCSVLNAEASRWPDDGWKKFDVMIFSTQVILGSYGDGCLTPAGRKFCESLCRCSFQHGHWQHWEVSAENWRTQLIALEIEETEEIRNEFWQMGRVYFFSTCWLFTFERWGRVDGWEDEFQKVLFQPGGKGNQWDGGWELGRMIKIMRVVFFGGDDEDEQRRLTIILTTISHMS